MNLLEFLIPTYKRLDGAVVAARSIACQILEERLEKCVSIRIVDDKSPNFSMEAITNALSVYSVCIDIQVNKLNKGMSQNIFDMVRSSEASFCTVLTDDDWLFPGALSEIIKYLQEIDDKSNDGGLFTPRCSYLETGELVSVVCKPFNRDKLIPSGPVAAIRYCHNGFVLTGFIFRPRLMAIDDWRKNIDNSFFPIINFWGVLSASPILFVDKNWFRHTVLNVCHWEAWGAGKSEQGRRLYSDYMDAIGYVADRSWQASRSSISRLGVFCYEITNYSRQMQSYLLSPDVNILQVSRIIRKKTAFWIVVSVSPFILVYVVGRTAMVRLLKSFLKSVGIPWAQILLR